MCGIFPRPGAATAATRSTAGWGGRRFLGPRLSTESWAEEGIGAGLVAERVF